MKTSRWKLFIPLLVLMFPVVFWLILTRGHNSFKKLPYVGPFELSASGDTLYHTIPSFSFINQEGKAISSKDLEGKIYVANFFFANCKTVCPEMNQKVQKIQDAFKNSKDFQIVSFTVDPENDTPEKLKEYAALMKADSSKWWFLTGEKDSIYSLARNGFMVPASVGEEANDFFHSQDLILVDRNKNMRGIYDGLDSKEVDTLIDEVKVLMLEQPVSISNN